MAKPTTQATITITPEQLKAMIEEHRQEVALEMREAIAAALTDVVKYEDHVALEADNGLLIGAVGGGPTVEGQPVEFVSKTVAGTWESFKVKRGAP